jgi:hypothetical protein
MDAIALITDDHLTVEKLFRQYEKLNGGSPQQKKQLANQIVKELSMHSAIEEQVFYPSVRREIPDANPEVLQAIEEHHVVKWELSEIEDLNPDDERFDAKMTVLIENVRHHVKEEEDKILMRIAGELTPDQRESIGDLLVEAKKVAPTHPHPLAPDTPPGNIVAGVASSAYDRSKEAAKGDFERTVSAVKSEVERLRAMDTKDAAKEVIGKARDAVVDKLRGKDKDRGK